MLALIYKLFDLALKSPRATTRKILFWEDVVRYTQNPSRLLLERWSDQTKLRPGISKLSSSGATLESKYVSDKQFYVKFMKCYKRF